VNSALLRLPGEIRNTIYHYVLGGCDLYALFGGFGKSNAMFFGRPASSDTPLWLEPISKFLELQLLVVCRQIRAETIPFMFKFNSFGVMRPEQLPDLMDHLGAEQKANIETVKMCYGGFDRIWPWETQTQGALLCYMKDRLFSYLLLQLPRLKRVVLRPRSAISEKEREHGREDQKEAFATGESGCRD
jgi:hypothetical protein